MDFYKKSLIIIIFLAVILINYSFSIITPTDSRWTIPTSLSILRQGNIDLNEYEGFFETTGFHGIELIEGKYYNGYPIGSAIFALPMVLLLELNKTDIISFDHFVFLEKIISSLVLGIIFLLFFILASKFLSFYESIFLALVAIFCTGIWPTVGVAFWTHGPSIIMLLLVLYFIILAKERPQLIKYIALFLAFAFIIRPSNIVSLIVISCYIFFSYKKYFISYILFLLSPLLVFMIYNLNIYNMFLPAYYLGDYLTGAHAWEALIGNLISPSRGLLIFSPILIFSFYGIVYNLKKRNELSFILVLILILHWIVISLNSWWWAGTSFGPRLFTEMLPYFIFFLIPVFNILKDQQGIKKTILLGSFLFLTFISFFINFQGATNIQTYIWNQEPINIDESPSRIWDVRDMQFLRGVASLL